MQTVSLSNADKVRIGNASTAATEVVSTPLAIPLQQSSVTTSCHWRARPPLCPCLARFDLSLVRPSCLDTAFTGPSRGPQAYILLLTHGAHPVLPLITGWWYKRPCCGQLQKTSTPRCIAVNVPCESVTRRSRQSRLRRHGKHLSLNWAFTYTAHARLIPRRQCRYDPLHNAEALCADVITRELCGWPLIYSKTCNELMSQQRSLAVSTRTFVTESGPLLA